MRAWIVSDIHFSAMELLQGRQLQVPDADLCICSGDISNSVASSIAYLRRTIEPRMPVLLVLGNHDYYGMSISHALERARDLTAGTNIHLLEDATLEVSGCRFIGSTLWTDFAVETGGDEHVPPEERRTRAFGLVPYQMADFHCIYRSDARQVGENGMLTVQEIVYRHIMSRTYIDRELEKPFAGPSVVITHHAPHMQSFDPKFHGAVTNAAFGSDLSDLIRRRRPDVWIHGHIHCHRDYMADKTRIICNPRGYSIDRGMTGFRPDMIIDL